MFERFTEKSRRALFFARYFATQERSVVMQPEHLLEGVLEASPASVSEAAATVEVIRDRLSMTQPDTQERPTLHEIIFSPALKRVLQNAAGAADALGHRSIRPEHLLIALLAEEESAAARALGFAGVERAALEIRAGHSDEHLADAVRPAGAPEAKAVPSEPGRCAILHDVSIAAPAHRVFDAVSLPAGLDAWWTLRSSAGPRAVGTEYLLDFGPGSAWRAVVTVCERPSRFEMRMTHADEDWRGTRVAFALRADADGRTLVQFAHAGWAAEDRHYRVSAYRWAMYLRILRRHLERGESVPFEERLDA